MKREKIRGLLKHLWRQTMRKSMKRAEVTTRQGYTNSHPPDIKSSFCVAALGFTVKQAGTAVYLGVYLTADKFIT